MPAFAFEAGQVHASNDNGLFARARPHPPVPFLQAAARLSDGISLRYLARACS